MTMTDVHGPIDYVLLEFPGSEPPQAAGDALRDLVDQGTIRLYDLLVISKDENGAVVGFEYNDVTNESMGGFRMFAGARSGLLNDEDVREASEAMKPGSTAALIVYENAWAVPFVAAAVDAGGELVASARIPGVDVMRVLDELEASS